MPSEPKSAAFSTNSRPGWPPVMMGGTSSPVNAFARFADVPASKPM